MNLWHVRSVVLPLLNQSGQMKIFGHTTKLNTQISVAAMTTLNALSNLKSHGHHIKRKTALPSPSGFGICGSRQSSTQHRRGGGHRMTDIDNLRLLAAARAADDPMAAYALDGCADEIERLRWELRSYEQLGGDADRYSAIWREENPLNDMEPKT